MAQNPHRQFEHQFPLSAKYDVQWVQENLMGPNVLWLAEAAAQVMDLKPGMRVLDLGCGKAISSIFLAKEFGVQVWATDLWISPTENWNRIVDAGVDDRVYPIHAEAHALPYAEGFFDAAISLDAYHYFGTDDLYAGWYFNKLLKPGAQFCIVVPGIREEIPGEAPPEHLKQYWSYDFYTFHSPEWWARNLSRSGMLTMEHADWLQDGWKHWLEWEAYTHGDIRADTEEMLRVDAGRLLGFSRLVARKR